MNCISVGTSAYQDKTAFYIKQFFHYMALAKFSNSVSFEGSDYVKFVPNLFSSPIQLFYYLLDCHLPYDNPDSNLKIVYIRTIWTLCIPFTYALILLFFYSLYVKIVKKKFNKHHIFNAAIFFLLFTQPGILGELLKAVSCRTIAG